MAHKFSLAHLTVLGCAPPEITYIAAMAGYDYVSLRPIYMGLPGEPNYDLANNRKMLKDTKIALNDTGLKVHDIELAKIEAGRNVKQYEPAMEVAAELGAKSILSSIWIDDRDFYIDQFSQLCILAKQYNLNVDLEFVTWASVKDLSGAMDVLNTVNQENSGIMIDTLHFNRSKVSYDELKSIPEKYFHFAHLCDGPAEIPLTKEGLIQTGRDERLYIDEGGIPLIDIINCLPDDITFSIELPHLERVKVLGNAEHARRCLQSAKDFVKRNNL